MTRCSWDAEMDAALQADAEKLLGMGADPGPELEDLFFICPVCGGNDDDQQLMCEACGGAGWLGEHYDPAIDDPKAGTSARPTHPREDQKP